VSSPLDARGQGESVRAANKGQREYDRASWAKKARGTGLRPADLHQLAADILAHDAALAGDRAAMLKEARTALDHYGGKHRTISAAQGRGGRAPEDATSIRGIDQVAGKIAQDYPHLFRSGNADDQLFEMLSGPPPMRMTEGEAYEQAFDHLQAAKAEDVVPFERR
jgi:hypothetical protein